MNKKFINGLLLASLILGGASGLTSCKDYDDDIDNLQTQIDGIDSRLKEIEKLVQSGCVITDVVSVTNGVKVVLSNGRDFTITNGTDGKPGADGKNGTVWTIGQDGYWYCDGQKTDYPARGPQGEKGDKGDTGAAGAAGAQGPQGDKGDTGNPGAPGAKGNYYVPNTETKTFWEYDGATNQPIKDTGISYIGTYTGVTAVDNGYEILLFGVDPNDPGKFFRLSKSSALKSVVLIPELYADGIESVEYGYTYYNPFNTTSGTLANVDNSDNVKCTVTSPATEWNYKKTSTVKTFSPIWGVNYHLNPSAALVQASKVSPISNEVETISRAASASAGISFVESGFASADGIMTVGLRVANPLKIKTAADKEATIFAAQVKVDQSTVAPDTTITSDYAMVYGSKIIPQAIAFGTNAPQALDCPKASNNDELYTTMEEAIKGKPSLTVAYTETLNLNNLEIHYKWDTNSKKAGDHLVWKYGEEAPFGLSYDYKLIDYAVGTNQTSDSKYCKLNGSVLTPYAVNAQGDPATEFGVASVGRQPIVRVRVMEGNNVVLVGFIKVIIKKESSFKVTSTVSLEEIKFGCSAVTRDVNWAVISDYVLQNTAAQSKAEFDALYKLDVDANGNAKQFNAPGLLESTDDNRAHIGEVVLNTNPTGTTTTILVWNLSQAAQQTIYEKANHTATIYVRYVHKVTDSEHLYAPIYVPLKVSVSKPTGNVTTKVDANWMRNKTVNILNVPQPDNGKTPNPFLADLDDAWATRVSGVDMAYPSFNPTTGYTAYTAATFKNEGMNANGGYVYYFTAANNGYTYGNYTFEVDKATAPGLLGTGHAKAVKDMGDHALLAFNIANGVATSANGEYNNNTLYAKKNGVRVATIATIDQTTGKITYEKNAVSEELLNMYASNGNGMDRSNAKLNLNIGICAYTACGVALKLDNGMYDAVALRPINVYVKDGISFTDATANGSRVNVFDILTFDDWRGQGFTGNNGWFFAYYGVKDVKVNLAGMTTNAVNGGNNFAPYQPVTDSFSMSGVTTPITWSTAEINATQASADINKIKAALGQIVYDNTKFNRNTFQVKFNIEVVYDWGTIVSIPVTATVNNTLNPGN